MANGGGDDAFCGRDGREQIFAFGKLGGDRGRVGAAGAVGQNSRNERAGKFLSLPAMKKHIGRAPIF